jgi:glycosyltransferase involved in cell wall biosynthesis
MRAAAGKPRVQGLVSVIMPFLDTPERFFREAVTSLRAQLYEHWELLLIDDG